MWPVRFPTHALIALILFVGFVARLPHLADPPLRFHPTRQYRSALIARGYYIRSLQGLTPAALNAARVAAASQGTIEPPLMEHLAAWLYRAAGREGLWLPRLVSVLAWSAGGVALWWLAESLFSPPAAVAAVTVYMFLPWGIAASQAFQPDPLMVGLTVATLAAALHQHRQSGARPARSWVIVSGFAVAAVLAKPMALFFFAPVILTLAIQRTGWRRGFCAGCFWILAVSLPAAAFYYFGTEGVFESRFFPQLWTRPPFWQGWAAMLNRVAGWHLVLAALSGTVLAARSARAFVLALWSGYLTFGLTFAYHIYTHDYYSLPLVPIVALSVGAIADRVARIDVSPSAHRRMAIAGVAVLIVAGGLSLRAAEVFASSAEVETEAAGYQRIGELVRHSTRVAALDSASYGYAINYHGFISATNWPLSIDLALARLSGEPEVPAAQRFASLAEADFFIATNQMELNLQPDLRAFLGERLVLARDGSPDSWRYVVYDLNRPGATLEPERLSVFSRINGAPVAAQTVRLRTLPTGRWRIEVPTPELFDVQPSTGTGPAALSITPREVSVEVDRTVDVPVYTEGSVPQGMVTVRFRAAQAAQSAGPFGVVDSPADPVVVAADPVTFVGWALDDFDLRRVWAGYKNGAGVIVPVGDALRLGMRPDVAKIYPNKHDIFHSAWTVTLSPDDLARLPQPAVLRFYAENGDGQRTEIGTRAITSVLK
jgi:hypothetical protein